MCGEWFSSVGSGVDVWGVVWMCGEWCGCVGSGLAVWEVV